MKEPITITMERVVLAGIVKCVCFLEAWHLLDALAEAMPMEPEPELPLTERMRQWRERNGLSYAQAARKMATSAGVWQGWETGLIRPIPRTVASIERLLG